MSETKTGAVARHPYDELIRDWLDGKVVQYRPTNVPLSDPWRDLEPAAQAVKLPHFYTDGSTEYRRKPIVVRYRVALMVAGQTHFTASIGDLKDERLMQNDMRFVRWLTEWTEVEV